VPDVVKHNRLIRMVDAILMATPFCMASRFDHYAHCVSVSNAGAAVLRRLGATAQAIPCSLFSAYQNRFVWTGHTRHSAYMSYTKLIDPSATQEDFNQLSGNVTSLDDVHPIHMVIDALLDGRRALIDLTLGQVRRLGIDAPLGHAFYVDGWPTGAMPTNGPDRTVVVYSDCVHRNQLPDASKSASFSGLTDDLADMTALALQSGGVREKFYRSLRSQLPSEFSRCARKLEELGKLGGAL
jgi:hypothetical protein